MSISASDHAIETFRSLITISLEALKALVLLNGGAVVAILAYLGQIDDRATVAAQMTLPLGWFLAGLFLTAAAFVGSYMTQLSLYNEAVLGAKSRHAVVLWIAIAFAVASVASFGAGAIFSIKAFSTPVGIWL